MSWHGSLSLRYRVEDGRTLVHDRHDGPLRVLRSLYPESAGVCHNVLVHPPGGIVGGDTLAIDLALEPGAHALVTTPGATRFYRSAGTLATQALTARVETGARLEWLPLETIAYSGCIAENKVRFDLDAGAEMIGWDLTALGLPTSDQPFVAGSFSQSIEFPGRWLERGTVRGEAPALLDSPLGWAGQRVLATLWFAAGGPIIDARRDALLEAARAAGGQHALHRTSGATAPHAGVVVVRVLAPKVEPAMALLSTIWSAWRRTAWQLEPCVPRVWRT
ncbi:MAG: urease accessory protein UreD [Caldimonas sp.]